MRLTNEQWNRVAPHITHIIRADKRGKKRLDDRLVLEGILWIPTTGAQWKHLPKEYPSYQTCHRRFQEWRENGVFASILTALAQDLELRGKLTINEAFIDGRSCVPKKGVSCGLYQDRERLENHGDCRQSLSSGRRSR
jgi:transposase